MKQRPGVILLLMLLLVGSTAGFLLRLKYHQKLGNPGVKVVAQPVYGLRGQLLGTNSVYLPERVLNYGSHLPAIDDSVLSWLPKDTTYGQRIYQGPDGFQAQIAVVLMGTDRTSIHKPQYCLPAQGWSIVSSEQASIEVTEPYPYSLPVMKLFARREGQNPAGGTVVRHGINIYWFVGEEQLTANHNDWMWSMFKTMLRKGELQRWAYVSCFATCAPGQEQATYERIAALIAATVPQFQLVSGPPANLSHKQGG